LRKQVNKEKGRGPLRKESDYERRTMPQKIKGTVLWGNIGNTRGGDGGSKGKALAGGICKRRGAKRFIVGKVKSKGQGEKPWLKELGPFNKKLITLKEGGGQEGNGRRQERTLKRW